MNKSFGIISAIIFFSILIMFCGAKTNKMNGKNIREPAVAGTFYSANKEDLRQAIEQYLSKAEKKKVPKGGGIIGLIAPHAGYVYSGQVAAEAYKQIENQHYDTVIILGVAHRYPIRTPSIYTDGFYKTPLGLVEVDDKACKELMQNYTFLKFVPEAHKLEHSIEVQIPFLQMVIKNKFKIVPILLSHFPYEIVNSVADAISKLIQRNKSKRFLIVASSDLSHYPAYNDAKKVDKDTIRLIKDFKVEELIQREQKVEDSGVENLVTYQCGLGAITTLMLASKKLDATDVTLIDYKNSGDTSWIKERVVGYTAMMFSGKNIKKDKNSEVGFDLTKEEKKFLLKMSRKVLEEYVRNHKIPEVKIDNEKLKKDAGAFVTLNKNHNLRGCIGYIMPIKPLYKSVIENTVNACSRDPRFTPVTSDELKNIEIEISVLSPPVSVESYKDIIIGQHGIILKKGFNQAVFLPQVAPEQGWDLATTLTHLSLKAGLGPNDWQMGCQYEVFTAIVFKESEFK